MNLGEARSTDEESFYTTQKRLEEKSIYRYLYIFKYSGDFLETFCEGAGVVEARQTLIIQYHWI